MMKRILVVCALLSGVLRVDAQTSARDLLQKIQKHYEKMTDAGLTFSQTTYLPVAKVTQHATGTLRMKQKNKYRIETENELLVTDGVTVWRMNRAKKQVLIDTYKDDPKNLTPDKLLLNVPNDYASIRVGSETIEGKELSILKLTPKNTSSVLSSIKLWIDEDDLVIRKVETVNFSDTRTTYTISKFSMNTGVSDSLFIFTPPDGIEMIDLR
jgi:outer membrane lipoprotein carrier protein